MSDITIAQILNEIDQIEYILYTEWKSTCFKIMLLKSSAVPLMGEVIFYLPWLFLYSNNM